LKFLPDAPCARGAAETLIETPMMIAGFAHCRTPLQCHSRWCFSAIVQTRYPAQCVSRKKATSFDFKLKALRGRKPWA
jgi:hypothetical protein